MSNGFSRRNIYNLAGVAAASILGGRGALAQIANLQGQGKNRPRTAKPV